MSTIPTLRVENAVGLLVDRCHGDADKAGWWLDSEGDTATIHYERDVLGLGIKPKRNIAELLCLIHSEISEAMEGARKRLYDDKLPHRPMLEVELADALIRICDMAGGLGLDLGGAVEEKLAYNRVRIDHRLESRAAAGGKQF